MTSADIRSPVSPRGSYTRGNTRGGRAVSGYYSGTYEHRLISSSWNGPRAGGTTIPVLPMRKPGHGRFGELAEGPAAAEQVR